MNLSTMLFVIHSIGAKSSVNTIVDSDVGCKFAAGSVLVFISGHCVPRDSSWLRELVDGIYKGCDYVYGRQVGRDTTKFSERQLFAKYFPEESKIPQVGFFCNNANAALRRDAVAALPAREQPRVIQQIQPVEGRKAAAARPAARWVARIHTPA